MFKENEKRNPRRWTELRERETFIHRNQGCKYYDECLMEAAQSHWEGFSCLYCSFNGDRKNDFGREKDFNALMKLITKGEKE